jgi:hypothetical protein
MNTRRVKENYEGQIEDTNFGTIADCLHDGSSSIHFVLHVKEKTDLPRIAQALERELEASGFVSGRTPECLKPLFSNGDLMYSLREDRHMLDEPHVISAWQIDRDARCEAIDVKPFSVVHTPGLFQGKHQTPRQGLSEEAREYQEDRIAELEEGFEQEC